MKYLIVDSTNNFIRNYAVVPTMDLNGNLNGGTIGFLRSLAAFIYVTRPDKVILVWDGPNGSAKRRAIFKEYKEGRKPIRLNRDPDFDHQKADINKVEQRIRLGEYLEDLPVYQISVPDIEADDVIGYLCRLFKEDEKVIVSGDKDMFQLISPKTSVYVPIKKEFYSDKNVFESFGVHCCNLAIGRALVGDDSDNLRGVKGIGFKTLVKLFPFLQQDVKIELKNIFEHCEQNKSDKKNGDKYQRILDCTQIVIDNYNVMQLENPIIGLTSIHRIERSLEKEMSFNATSFRLKTLEDGVTTFNDSFYSPFRGIIANLPTKRG